MWPYRFIKRLPDNLNLQLVKQKPIDAKRVDSYEIGEIVHWFDLLEPYIRRIPPCNIYNFDESGFQVGQGKPQKVVTANPHRATVSTGGHGESLTVIECIAADGWVMSPYFIVAGEHHLERWFHPNLPDDYRIATSPKGYITKELAFDWLRFFHENTSHRANNEPRLLLFDGHRTHLTYAFLRFCEFNNIIPYCFVPHTTHFAQPLDGHPFLAYKHYYRSANNAIVQWGGSVTDKADFFRDIPRTRRRTFKASTIQHAFADRGIYPFNPSKVIDPLMAAQPDKPDLHIITEDTPPPLSSSTNSPPSTIRGLRRSIDKAKLLIQEDSEGINPSLRKRLDLLFEASLVQGELAAQQRSNLEQLIGSGQTKTTSKSRRQVRSFGPLNVKDANIKIGMRERGGRGSDTATAEASGR
jgi:hypothetical protein